MPEKGKGTAAGDAPQTTPGKGGDKGKKPDIPADPKGKKGEPPTDTKGKKPEVQPDPKGKKGTDVATDPKGKKGEIAVDPKGKKIEVIDPKGKKGAEVIELKKGLKKGVPELIPEELIKTPSQIALEEAEYRAMLRRTRFKRKWPEITKPKIRTQPWFPPTRPQRPPRPGVELPELKLRKWVPPYRRRRRPRPRLQRIPAAELTKRLYPCNVLKKIWHNFTQVDRNKMMLQGSFGCNSKRYSSTTCGAQTGCIAVVAQALLDMKDASQLVKVDVDDVIEAGDRYFRQCHVTMKCYKGNPALALNQLLQTFFLRDIKFTIKMNELESGVLAVHPDNVTKETVDLQSLMEKRAGTTFSFILTIGGTLHFLIWGHPPAPEYGSNVKTIVYLFDPHMLDGYGNPHKLYGAGGFLRYAGIASFLLDFLGNYGKLNADGKCLPRPPITLTNVEVIQKEPLIREPNYSIDLKMLKVHCQSEWEAIHRNELVQKKAEGKYPRESLSMVSLATTRSLAKKGVQGFYQKSPPKEPTPTLPVAPERGPARTTPEQLMQLRGEDFFLYCPDENIHTFGRDDLLPLAKSETILHSPVAIAEQYFCSQYEKLDPEKWILRGTRHMASKRYSIFKVFTAVPCCVVALGILHRHRARAWNEDTVDETLEVGYNYYRDSMAVRGGPIRRLVLGELKESLWIRDKELFQTHRGIAVWGRLMSNSPTVMDLYRGVEAFFKEADAGILQIPGEYETAILHEGSRYYLYHPWPADKVGKWVGLQDGGKACILAFSKISKLCDHFMESVMALKRKPFSISDVYVYERKKPMPEPIYYFKSVDTNRWVVHGSFHEADPRFPEVQRGKQGTPTAIVALALSHVIDSDSWNKSDVNECLIRGDSLYQSTIENLDKLGISLDAPKENEDDAGGDEEEEKAPTGMLAAADVLNRFKVSDFDCIETEVAEGKYCGSLHGNKAEGLMSLKDALRDMFKEHEHAVVISRGCSLAVWREKGDYYIFDPHRCDDNGYPTDEPRGVACLIRVKGGTNELADAIESNLPPGRDDSFNVSPVEVTALRLNPELGAPEYKPDSKAYQWLKRGASAIMMGPRGENSGLGKAATKAGLFNDFAGRIIALPAAAAFCAAAEAVPPPHMHQDHMFNFLDAGADYYNNFEKKTGKRDITVEDLTEKFEMGANTFSIELGEATRLPLRFPDKIEEGEGGGEPGLGEGEEPKEVIKEMRDLLWKKWYDNTVPRSVFLLVGDYHQLGVWMAAGGKVVAFDPAPTLYKGALTINRITKGDELRLRRLKEENPGEGGDEDAEDEEAGEEGGEEKPEPPPEFVPPESCPALWAAASPGEFIDKLVFQAPLDKKQMIAPYKLYPVKVTNQLTYILKEKKQVEKAEDEAPGAGDEEEEEQLIDPVSDAAMGKYFTRVSRGKASVRGQVAQNEAYFMESPNRDNQDAAIAVLAIAADHIEPYTFWKPPLIDAIMKYGDRLYTLSLMKASAPPRVKPEEVVKEFHVTKFNIKVDVEPSVVTGDVKAGPSGQILNLKRGLASFFESCKYGVICAKDYCVAVWKAPDDKCLCLFDPHAIGPGGRSDPAGAAGLVVYTSVDELAAVFKHNIERLARPGTNKFSIASVKVTWELSKALPPVTHTGAAADDGYEWKVLTAYVEMAKGRTILRGTRPTDVPKFIRDSVLQSSCGAIVAAAMSHVRKPHLWTRRTVDEIMCNACGLLSTSLGQLGYEFRPNEDVLLPLQVVKRFVLGVNYVRYDLDNAFTGRLEQINPPTVVTCRAAVEQFFEHYNTGILWCSPHAVAIWRTATPPAYYMMEPHLCSATGLRIDGSLEEGAPCVLTFTSPKLLAYGFLQNYPVEMRRRHEFRLYAMSVVVSPIRRVCDPPLTVPGTVPATSKVNIRGLKRRANERDRKHPPGDNTCLDAQRATEKRDAEQKLRGMRNTSGWLVIADGSQFLSATHSMNCSRFSVGSRGHQAIPCCVMAVAMSKVDDVCRWCGATLDAVLDSGDQLYQDSVLHYRPAHPTLDMTQVLRKFYTPGNCVCRVLIFEPRQEGTIDDDSLQSQITQFFTEERMGVFACNYGNFAVALFRTERGFYMFDPADRDRYGRAVAPPCFGKARACLSRYKNIKSLVEKLEQNIPPEVEDGRPKHRKQKKSHHSDTDSSSGNSKISNKKGKAQNKQEQERKEREVRERERRERAEEEKEVHWGSPTAFAIYGMEVTGLRRLNKHER